MPNQASDRSHTPASMPESDPVEDARMSFGDHLEELRTCLVHALFGFVLAAGIALALGRHILALVFHPLWQVQLANGLQPKLQALSPMDGFSAYLRISILAGAILSMPWILHQGWKFVAAGLYPHERKFVKRLTVASGGLFVAGVLFLYFVVLPVVLQFFILFNRAFQASNFSPTTFHSLVTAADPADAQAQGDDADVFGVPMVPENPADPSPGQMWVNTTTRRLVLNRGDELWSAPLQPGAIAPAIDNQFAIPAYISFVLMLALAFGVAFETPIVVLFLAWSSLVPAATMARSRRYVLMAIILVAAVMTPPDVVSQLLLAIPMYGLFELGLVLAHAVEKRRAAQQA